MNNEIVESTLGKYLEFKVFALFRDRLTNIIKEYSKEGSKIDLYNHLFLCPSNLSQKRNFQIHGVLSPYVCLWRTSLFEWNKMFYGRSVLPRVFRYLDQDNNETSCSGFLYDIQCTFELSSSSYYKDFRDRVNQDLLDFDRLRYFDIDVSELLPNCKECITRCELILEGLAPSDKLEKEPRSFNLNAKYTMRITIPYTNSKLLIERMNLYLENNLIYSKDYTETEKGSENQTPTD